MIERAGGRNANGWKIVGRYCWFAEFKSSILGLELALLDPTLLCCIPKRLRILQCVRLWMPF